jgi:hypothetical protein
VVENSHRPEVPLANMGSFDFVWLSPHFAQDDRVKAVRIRFYGS